MSTDPKSPTNVEPARHLLRRIDQFLDNLNEVMTTAYVDLERLITEARDEIDEHLNPR